MSTVEAAEFRAGWTRGRRAFRELTTDGCVRHPAHLETVAARRTGVNGRSTRNGREVDTTELELFHNKWQPILCYTMKTFGRRSLRAGWIWGAYAHGKYFHNFFDMYEKETCKAHILDLATYGDILNIENGNSYGG